MFVLKKIVSAFLYPVPLALLILFVGVVMLWRKKTQTWGRRLTTVGFLLLVLFSFRLVPSVVVRALENDYPVFAEARYPDVDVKWVVVLAGGVRDDPALPPNDQLTASSLARLVEGVRVLSFYPDARLLLAGKGYFSTIPEAVALQGTAEILGVEPARIRLEEESIDTADHTAKVQAIIGEDPFVLVTSAVHLPRAMALFEHQGMHPLPAPAYHLVRPTGRLQLASVFPNAGNLYMLRFAWHEYLGLLWSRLNGQL